MIKPLLITSLCAFLAAAGFFSLAAASGVAHGGGNFWQNLDNLSVRPDEDRRDRRDGPVVTRTIPWTGGDTLEVSLGADVQYTQGPVANLTVTGGKSAVDNVMVSNGEIRFSRSMQNHRDVRIVMTAPDVTKFKLRGSHSLVVDNYDQDTMEVSLAGSGDIDLNGKARRLDLSIAGSGDVDAADLALSDATVSIAGSGDAKLAPTQTVDISIAGSGDVELTSHPATVKSRVAGSGSITQH